MWDICDINEMTDSINNLFKRNKLISKRSKIISNRENNCNNFLNRIKNQILEIHTNNLPYDTPEKWDNSFHELGGGQSRRTSSAILNRMTWDRFLEEYNNIIKDIKGENK